MSALPKIIQLDLPKATMRFQEPSIAEVNAYGKEIGLPENECKRFWLFYDSKDWMVGKSKMKKWRSALAGWHLRWSENRPTPSAVPKTNPDLFMNRWTVDNAPTRNAFQSNSAFESANAAYLKWKERKKKA